MAGIPKSAFSLIHKRQEALFGFQFPGLVKLSRQRRGFKKGSAINSKAISSAREGGLTCESIMEIDRALLELPKDESGMEVKTLRICNNQYIEMIKCHVNKISRLISKNFGVNEHINNMSSYRLSFFEELILCRGLKFSLPQKVSPIEIQASFEKAHWEGASRRRIKPLLEDADEKELASSTLHSIALNYIQHASPNPTKALVKALNRLKKRDDIVITKPDKVSSSLPNLPLDETIRILLNKAFTDDWFNKTYDLNLQQDQLARLLEIATTNQLFQLNSQLYQHTDGVAMSSPLGPLMANVFMCHREEKLTGDGLMPQLYKRYVDDTLARMPSADAAAEFLSILNGLHPSLTFTMELPVDNKIPFISIEIVRNGTKLETRVYRKPANTGLLQHFQNHTDKSYKDSLSQTMMHRAYALSSSTEAFNAECAKLRSIFSRLDYPMSLIDPAINKFLFRNTSANKAGRNNDECSIYCLTFSVKVVTLE
ncbi:hypothetical protein AWC38_SpisGene11201 [Stylophora pistillata]|uniref:Helix-turn-helix domain-containing protein n=1 Tax=Stylophora pistillata TaxID=50429 RepID=A0A2B4S0G8_STYPI|nr:hypothetical protein AWC38_SpisGene11201 [Stylophora pistillata]